MPTTTPQLTTDFGSVVCTLPASESYVGKDDGKTRYLTRCEVPACRGSRWSTVRLTVVGSAAWDAGTYRVCVRVYDGMKGEGRAVLLERV